MNLDLESARSAQEIIKNTYSQKSSEVDNLVTKTLGVLQENGVYACMLFLCSRTSTADTAVAVKVRKELLTLTEKMGKKPPSKLEIQAVEIQAVLSFLTSEICNDLDTLLFVKQLWEQTLTYARYGAKARE
ncbi:MAG: hypothetical protein WCE94_11905 [Candidatus Methanoperedens sp.]